MSSKNFTNVSELYNNPLNSINNMNNAYVGHPYTVIDNGVTNEKNVVYSMIDSTSKEKNIS